MQGIWLCRNIDLPTIFGYFEKQSDTPPAQEHVPTTFENISNYAQSFQKPQRWNHIDKLRPKYAIDVVKA
jgi:hypothetical protein